MHTAVECLAEHELLELARGALSGEAARRAHDHIDACADCRRVLARACSSLPAAGRTGVLAPGTAVDRYVIRQLVGMGGMGVVYAAHDPELDREVALKLVRDDVWAGGSQDDNRTRLVREARAIARLSHPNVVAVYDAGRHDGGVFVAMELVPGSDLARWLHERERPWREICAALVAAGRGLAAAHAAGLVHRDFKPANVLVGRDGRVRVGDFGLARPMAVADDPAAESDSDHASADRVTRTGALAGTPSYMAPEQFDGTATARSDQFSFCAAAYEALCGVRPFPGDTIAEIRARMASGEPTPPRRDVPASIRRALLRGLAIDPAARHPSMDGLLAQLAPTRRRTAFAIAGVALMATATVTWAIARREAPATCADPAPLLAGVWDPAIATKLERAFGATRVAHASAVWQQVRRTLDDYATGWLGMHREACRATRERHEQSEEVYQRRLACLEQRRVGLRLLTERFATIEPAGIERAPATASALASLDDCIAPAYQRALGSGWAPDRARAWEELEVARALFVVQSNDDAELVLERVLASAEALGDHPLRAEALVLRGRNASFRNDLAAAVQHLGEAVALAGEIGAEALRVEGWAFLSNALQRLGRFDEAARLLDLAEASLRAAPDPVREIEVASSRGMLHGRQSRYREAAERFEHAVALIARRYGEHSPKLTPSLRNLATALRRLGRLDEALTLIRRAYEIDRVLGDDHPKLARTRIDLAVVLSEAGRYDEALAELARAGTALRRARGNLHLDVADVEDHMAVVRLRQGRTRTGIEHLRSALAIRQELAPDATTTMHSLANLASALIDVGRDAEAEVLLRELLVADGKRLGPRHVEIAHRRMLLGTALGQLGRTTEARAELEAARTLFADLLGADHAQVADVVVRLAALERARRRFRAALALDREAQAIRTRVLPAEHAAHADSLAALALDHLGAGAAKQARASIEQAIDHRKRHGDAAHPLDRWVLARALWATGERARAVELARAVRGELAAVAEPDRETEQAAVQLDAWLAGK